jgi:hypothetical protein
MKVLSVGVPRGLRARVHEARLATPNLCGAPTPQDLMSAASRIAG